MALVDIWWNNAGINRDAMLHKLTEADWDTVIDVNPKGTFSFSRQASACASAARAALSISLPPAGLANVGQTNYSASKAGVVGMTKPPAANWRKGVTVNAICPGFIDTDTTRGVPENVWHDQQIPAGYAGEAKDVGECGVSGVRWRALYQW
ncbi:SDR family oxidoreductase [Klebsiella pneumoniae]|uniref:SDR family oxidoreductase n=1 Tax=Klebsiella pneumoniae TaxID=573 RepID=A0A939SVS4_KLEPN|nr:SDR family oxidoreductase [Klebsiella pneumoniae]